MRDDLVPTIALNRLPEDEQPHGFALMHNLRSMAMFVDEFGHALSLFDRCEAEIAQALARAGRRGVRLMRETASQNGWMRLALRQAALTTWDFWAALCKAKQNRPKCPTLSSYISASEMESASRLFVSYFPDRKDARDAHAHVAEIAGSADDIEKNALGDGSILIINEVKGRSITTMYDGRLVTSELSQATMDKLIEVQTSFYSAFNVEAGHEAGFFTRWPP
jgi:hypothetical protein